MFLFNRGPPDTAEADELFSEAYAAIEQGLCYDEVNDLENALIMYEKGLSLVKDAEKKKNAKKSEMYKNLIEAKKSVENRIVVMKKEGPKPSDATTEKNKAEEAMSDIRENLDSVGEQEAELVYFLPDGVQLFTIEGDETAAPTYPTSLEIFRFNYAEDPSFREESGEPSAFIQVGPWIYPLIKEQTPILRNDYGAYVVPNPTPDHPNMMVAILLPMDIEPRLEEEFRQVLGLFAILRDQEVKKELTAEENKAISKKIANFLISSGEKIAVELQTKSVKIASSMENRGSKYRSSLQQTEKPMNVNPAVKSSVVYMHKGSKVVAKCTRMLLDKIGDIGVSVGRSFANSAQKRFGDGKTGGLVSGTINVLGGGIASVSTVWIALEEASKNLCRSIAKETVENVRVKYGDAASETTHHALFAAGHSGLAAAQLWDLGPRSVAGRVARKAGIQVVLDLQKKEKEAGPLPIKKA